MVPRRHNVRTAQTLRCSSEPVLVMRQVLLSEPITALAAASPQRKVTRRLQKRRTSGPCGGRKEGPQGRNGSVNPLALRQCGTIIQERESSKDPLIKEAQINLLPFKLNTSDLFHRDIQKHIPISIMIISLLYFQF